MPGAAQARFPTRADIEAAADRIRPHVYRTPAIRVELGGRPVWLKLEHLQVTGSFKARATAPINLAIAQRAVERVVLVSDESILVARDLLWEACRLAVEPAAATGLAALLGGLVGAKAPCVVLCGANSTWTCSAR